MKTSRMRKRNIKFLRFIRTIAHDCTSGVDGVCYYGDDFRQPLNDKSGEPVIDIILPAWSVFVPRRGEVEIEIN